ncbi:hypothetical protein BL254_11720 [Protofrankia sp. BMG5.30]|uniref:Transposase n=1 Tax=Protofrankia coriariae TaxID=1562887 RepID=A0ABR5F5W8_9ACTN|nr:hypothetical protein FrCorBMG51_07240 [Protofrankia coriariae]ONH35338.1 hypothetical protein BL254_11720 [Protofrankia sp. BMG5.30]
MVGPAGLLAERTQRPCQARACRGVRSSMIGTFSTGPAPALVGGHHDRDDFDPAVPVYGLPADRGPTGEAARVTGVGDRTLGRWR